MPAFKKKPWQSAMVMAPKAARAAF